MSTQCALRANAISKYYKNVPILQDVTFSINAGEIVALLGENGAGKSTFVTLATGQSHPDKGDLSIYGKDPRKAKTRRNLGVMLQNVTFTKQLCVFEQIDLFRSYYTNPRSTTEIIELAGLENIKKRRLSTLSGGQARLVQFALAICGRPQLLILDEPSGAMDSHVRTRFWNLIHQEAKQGTAILLISHDLKEIETLASRFVVLNHGHLITSNNIATLHTQSHGGAIYLHTNLSPNHFSTAKNITHIISDNDLLKIYTNHIDETLRDIVSLDNNARIEAITRRSLQEILQLITKKHN